MKEGWMDSVVKWSGGLRGDGWSCRLHSWYMSLVVHTRVCRCVRMIKNQTLK